MSVHIIDSTVFASAWGTPELRALFDEKTRVQGWLELLVELAKTQAEFGLIPNEAAVQIEQDCGSIKVNAEYLTEIGAEFQKTNHSLAGFVRATQQRCRSLSGEYFCYGVTVQDVTDTQLMRTLLSVHEIVSRDVQVVEHLLVKLAREHRNTVMCGRTHGQPGLPITFGFKVAGWLDEMQRHRERLAEIEPRLKVGQLAGGVGSLSSLGANALQLQVRFMQRVGLDAPAISWTASRDRLAEWTNLLALISATGDRIGQEIYDLQRPEIGEASEGFTPGTIGSITMPQKRNPEIAEHLGTLARVVRHHAAHMAESLVHRHERDGRSWKSEWHILPDISMAAAKSLALLEKLVSNVEVYPQRMRENLEAGGGFVFAEAVMLEMAKTLGKQTAHGIVYAVAMRAQAAGIDFKPALLADKAITENLEQKRLESLFDLEVFLGECAEMVDQVLSRSTAKP
ncbi:MAG: class-II fumarase/aspartase family protein [Pseudomonadales bacterium]